MKFLQGNLNHSSVAQDMLAQYVVQHGVDVVLLSDPYKTVPESSSWLIAGGTRRAAIWITDERVTVADVHSDPEFVSARLNGIQVFSCYVSPRQTIAEFNDFLQRLEDRIRQTQSDVPILVMGDFNARSAAWGDQVTNGRGHDLGALFETLELVIANTGSTPTFPRGNGSIIDITVISESLVNRLFDWRVMHDEYNNSDHHYLRFTINVPERRVTSVIPTTSGWNTSRGIDIDAFRTGLLLAEWIIQTNDAAECDVESAATIIETKITEACNFALPTKPTYKHGKPPVHWWNGEIHALRQECVRTKRIKTRMEARINRLRRRANREGEEFDSDRAEAARNETGAAHREAKRQLKNAIRCSKKACWKELINEVNKDPFGKPYKLVMRKLRGPPITSSMETQGLLSIMDGLFPTHQQTDLIRDVPAVAESELFSIEEVNAAVEKFKRRNKTPGPDGITTKILGAVHTISPGILTNLYNLCLQNGTFPAAWKKSRIVLLKKGDKPANIPSSYRPLCLLNDTGKIMEHLLACRLEAVITRKGGLATNQFGFRKGVSTDDAVRKLHQSTLPRVNEGQYCLAVSIDIKNAFNTLRWTDILKTLAMWDVPEYLFHMFGSYFNNRSGTVVRDPALGNRLEVSITSGVPQGSVVGPLLWNMTYDAILKKELPHGTEILGFADDTMLIGAGKSIAELEERVNTALDTVTTAISDLGLDIAAEKTEAVLFTNKYKYSIPRIEICGSQVTVGTEMTYLGIVVDKDHLYKAHKRRATDKAERIGAQLSRLMPNIGGPREYRRRLLSSVVNSILLYGAPLWAHTLPYVTINTRLLNKTQRKVLLRVICAYRTVSETAANILSSTPPADLLAIEREADYMQRRGISGGSDTKDETYIRWNTRATESTTGEWTISIVGDIKTLCRRKHGQLNFHMTQVLSGHGCFGKYLHRIGKETTEACHHCEADVDDARHTLLECEAWEEDWNQLAVHLAAGNGMESIVKRAAEDPVCWEALNTFCHNVMRVKEEAERVRRGEHRA